MTARQSNPTAVLSSPDHMSPPRLALRKEEAATALGISDESFDRYCRPHLRVVRWGTIRVYPVAELAALLEREATAPFEDRNGEREPVAARKALQNGTAVKAA